MQWCYSLYQSLMVLAYRWLWKWYKSPVFHNPETEAIYCKSNCFFHSSMFLLDLTLFHSSYFPAHRLKIFIYLSVICLSTIYVSLTRVHSVIDEMKTYASWSAKTFFMKILTDLVHPVHSDLSFWHLLYACVQCMGCFSPVSMFVAVSRFHI